MSSPKQLEGEVDHSFFDSDCDASDTKPEEPVQDETKDRNSTKEEHPDQLESSEITRGVKETESTNEEHPDQPESSKITREIKESESTNEERPNQPESSKITKEVEEPESLKEGSEETENPECGIELLEKEMSGLEVQRGFMDDSECKEDSVQKDEATCEKEDSDTLSRKSSPLAHSEMSLIRGSQADVSSSICSSPSSSAAEEDVVFKNKEKSHHRREPATKSPGKFRTRSSSSSSSRERSTTSSAKLSNTESTLSPRRQPRPRSFNRKQRPRTSEIANSDDTVTDVTPLSSPDINPPLSFDLALPTSSESPLPKDTPGTTSARQLDPNAAGRKRSAVPSGHRKMDRVLHVSTPGSTSVSSSRKSSATQRHKNYSFSTDEVRRIERENQRLVRELSHSSTRPLSCSTYRSYTPPFRPYHSALNRQREQRRIHQANLAFLKRLEAVKPTPGMTRIEQLTDYQRQAGYLGIPTAPFRPTSGRTTRTCNSTSQKQT
ncbi:cilia- and flagella-associated protein 97 isoform 2-T2 [Clarias gariepinus]